MPELHFTRHARIRMGQRGFRDDDAIFIHETGTPVAEDAFFFSDKDAKREIARNRNRIQQIERLRGTMLVVERGCVITLYHSNWRPSRTSDRQSSRSAGRKPFRPSRGKRRSRP